MPSFPFHLIYLGGFEGLKKIVPSLMAMSRSTNTETPTTPPSKSFFLAGFNWVWTDWHWCDSYWLFFCLNIPFFYPVTFIFIWLILFGVPNSISYFNSLYTFRVLFDINTKSWSTPPSLIWMLVLPNVVFRCFWQIWVSGRGSFSLTFVSNRSVTTALFHLGSMCQWPIGHFFVCDTKAFYEIAFQIKRGSTQFEDESL